MRVLNLVTTPRPFFDGQVETLERKGVECDTVSIPRPDGRETRSVTDYLKFYPTALANSLSGYDVIHANYGLTAPFALAQPKRPVVLTLWGTDLMSDRAWLSQLSRGAARLADAVVLPSETMSRRLEESHTVIPFGVDTEQFRPMPRDDAREHLGWDPDQTVVLFPYDPSRDVKDYPRARELVDAADIDAQLKIVSGVPYDEMPYYMNASDALLLTSKRESGPMVVKEAAACNLPVVSTDVGFARDVLSGVSNSAVATTNDELVAALERVLESPDRSDGRESIDGLSLDAMGERLIDVYERALSGGRGS